MIQASYDVNFFHRKLRVPYFTNLEKRVQGKPILVWNPNSKSIFFIFTSNFKLKLALPWPPFWPPFSKFEKYELSAFSGKKINVVTCLDQFLAICKMRWKKMDFQFYQNGRQKIAIFCPSAWFSKNFFLYYFTVSYIILNLLESYCKIQHMYSALKWHQDVLFWVPETPESLYNLSSEERNSSKSKCSWSSLQKLLCPAYVIEMKWFIVSGTENSKSWCHLSTEYMSWSLQ